MSPKHDWRRYLTFAAVAVVLGVVTAVTPAHQDVIVPIVASLFFVLFLLTYGLLRWTPELPKITTRKLFLLFGWLVVVLMADYWYAHSRLIREVPPAVLFLLVFLPAAIIVFFRRKPLRK